MHVPVFTLHAPRSGPPHEGEGHEAESSDVAATAYCKTPFPSNGSLYTATYHVASGSSATRAVAEDLP